VTASSTAPENNQEGRYSPLFPADHTDYSSEPDSWRIGPQLIFLRHTLHLAGLPSLSETVQGTKDSSPCFVRAYRKMHIALGMPPLGKAAAYPGKDVKTAELAFALSLSAAKLALAAFACPEAQTSNRARKCANDSFLPWPTCLTWLRTASRSSRHLHLPELFPAGDSGLRGDL
jgi:hypothetical protein